MPILLDDINPAAVYDADEIGAICDVHRTTVHKRIFPYGKTQRVGRRETTTGEQLIMLLRGEIDTRKAGDE